MTDPQIQEMIADSRQRIKEHDQRLWVFTFFVGILMAGCMWAAQTTDGSLGRIAACALVVGGLFGVYGMAYRGLYR